MKISKFNESVNVTPKKKSNFDYDEWENTVGKSSRIAAYRKYAGIAEDFEISESNIDEYKLLLSKSIKLRTVAQICMNTLLIE